MSKPNNDNDRIIVNVTNNITTSNTNTNNNENSNDNKNINKNHNANLGLYKFLTWAFGIILLFFFIAFCISLIQEWINTPDEEEYRNFNGNYNFVQEFNYFRDVTKYKDDWAISDIISIDGNLFGIYVPKTTEGLPDTVIVGDASDIYTFLDESYFNAKRIIFNNDRYILVAKRSKYKTIIHYRRRFVNGYEGQYARITQQGGQYQGSYYDKNNGPAYIYSMNGCSDTKIEFNTPLTDLTRKIKVAKGSIFHLVDCFEEPKYCDIIISYCDPEFYYDSYQWIDHKKKITIDDFFEFIKAVDDQKRTIMTIVKDDYSFIAQELKNE